MVEETFMDLGPRYLPYKKRCKDAKVEELVRFDQFEVYSEVQDMGHKRLRTNWVLTQNVKDAETKVKA